MLTETELEIDKLNKKIKKCATASLIFIIISVVCFPFVFLLQHIVPLAIVFAVPAVLSIFGLIICSSLSNQAHKDLDRIMVIVEEEQIRSDVRKINSESNLKG